MNNSEEAKESKRIEIIGYSFAILSFMVFIYTFCFTPEKELKQQSIFWFYTSLISALAPNIKQFKVKDFEVQFKDEIIKKIETKIDNQTEELNKRFNSVFEQVKRSEDTLSEEYKITRDEINIKYANRLQGLSPLQKLEQQKKHTLKHLDKFNLTLNDLQQMLKQIGFYKGSINGEFDEDLAKSISKFQGEFDLTPVDGICGLKTLTKLGEIINLKTRLTL